MQLPSSLLNSLADTNGFDKEAFEQVHASGGQVTSIRINPRKRAEIKNLNSKIPWTSDGHYLEQRPSFTFDPLFHAGCYYVLEASSMFVEQAFRQTADLATPLKVLDLCASPGGKSTHIQSLLSPGSLLVSNEVIRSRANVLKDNIIKWGCENVVVTNNDPKDFTRLENYFDVIVVDAPCSGSGLFRRDSEAIEEWSENNVQLCSQRQQRILADIWPALKKNGILIYSTCSYSKEEDEDMVNWLVHEKSALQCLLTFNSSWGIIESGGGYRFWPDKVKGEGFFLACFQKTDGEEPVPLKLKSKPDVAVKKDIEMLARWIKMDGLQFVKHLSTVYAWPQHLAADFSFLLENLRVIYSGVLAGELMRDKLVPDHSLAMSLLTADQVPRTALNYEQAIQYLQRKDIQLQEAARGWQLMTYNGHPLGWANVLSNRVNNYYPKELRILKDN